MATRKSFDKERWEAMTGMEMSQLLPECENPESAGEVTDHAGNEILPTVTEPVSYTHLTLPTSDLV